MRISVTGPTAWLIGGTNQGWVPPMHPAGGEALFQTAARLSSFCTPSCAPLIYPPTSFGLVGRSQWVSAKRSFSDKLFAWRGGGPDPPPTKLSLHFGSTWSRHGGGGPALGPLPGMRAGDVEERQIPPTYPGAKPPDAFLARCEERREWLFRGTKVKSPGAFRSTSSRARIYRE